MSNTHYNETFESIANMARQGKSRVSGTKAKRLRERAEKKLRDNAKKRDQAYSNSRKPTAKELERMTNGANHHRKAKTNRPVSVGAYS